jgi:signal transduction histidine kinase
MAISLCFSVTLYSLSMREFDRGFRRQDELINRIPAGNFLPPAFQRQFVQSRETAASEAKSRILSELFLVNVAIFLLGGGLSYFAARKTLEPIEEAHQSLERFTADASHELRTPIAAMKSEIEVALLQPKLKVSEAKEVLASNLEELDRLTALTSGLLSIARLEDSNLEIKSQPLEPIIKKALSKVAVLASEKSITFKTELSAKKPNVKADYPSLLESLVILLDNAIKYSPEGTAVEVKTRQKNDQTIISVVDHGIGITPEDLPHVFDRFYQADASRSQQNTKGHGLGLAIAKQLIERQNGTVAITSKPNQSTTATVTLPIN